MPQAQSGAWEVYALEVYPPGDLSWPCRPKACHGLVIMMMIIIIASSWRASRSTGGGWEWGRWLVRTSINFSAGGGWSRVYYHLLYTGVYYHSSTLVSTTTTLHPCLLPPTLHLCLLTLLYSYTRVYYHYCTVYTVSRVCNAIYYCNGALECT